MANIFQIDPFEFPYQYKFPGQASDERILFITRESRVYFWLRQFLVIGAGVVLVVVTSQLAGMLRNFEVLNNWAGMIDLGGLGVGAMFLIVGLWWVRTLWKNSVAVLTTKRLVKFIATSPWNKYDLSLPLDQVVDTGAYSKGLIEPFFKLGTLTARSSASSSGVATDDTGRVNKKYFYIDHIPAAQDLHHYLHKVLFVYRQDWSKLESYRPFLPGLKGDVRKKFMEQYPEYWS